MREGCNHAKISQYRLTIKYSKVRRVIPFPNTYFTRHYINKMRRYFLDFSFPCNFKSIALIHSKNPQ